MNQGTPKTLIEAVRNGMCVASGKTADQQMAEHIKDFLAQQFNIAVLKNPIEGSMLIELFKRITKNE